MSPEITLRACVAEDWPAFEAAMEPAFGNRMSDEGRDAWQRILDPAMMLVAVEREADRETVVGTAAWTPFDMTVPGGQVRVAGVTMVAVRPTHRRRGILRGLMTRQLHDLHAEEIAVATLWASESVIYQRFGYGMAFVKARIELDPRRARFLGDPEPTGRPRLVSEADSLAVIPPLYERATRGIPASFRRTPLWWEVNRLADPPSRRGTGGSPMFRMVLEIDGAAEGYALYRVFPDYGPDSLPNHTLEVLEALATTPAATREVWRYLFGVDLVARVRTNRLNQGHPLFLMLADARQLHLSLADGTWVRLADVAAALQARRYGAEGILTFELRDPLCPWNEGVWTLEAGPSGAALRRATAAPELRLSIAELGAMYLGTVPCSHLLGAGRLDELVPGAARRADLLFRSDVPPWCLDDF